MINFTRNFFRSLPQVGLAIIQCWYVLLGMLLMIYLLGFTNTGRDIMLGLLDLNTRLLIGPFLVLLSLFLLLFSITCWKVPVHFIAPALVAAYQSNLPQKRVYRFLGLLVLTVFSTFLIAHDTAPESLLTEFLKNFLRILIIQLALSFVIGKFQTTVFRTWFILAVITLLWGVTILYAWLWAASLSRNMVVFCIIFTGAAYWTIARHFDTILLGSVGLSRVARAWYRGLHWVVILSHFAVLVFFIVVPSLQRISTAFPLLLGIGLYIFLLDTLHYLFYHQGFAFRGFRVKGGTISLALTGGLLALFMIVYRKENKPARLLPMTAADRVRVTDTAYLAQWVLDRQAEIEDEMKRKGVYNVYLVAGQGGGSRAGYWFARTLCKIDSSTQGAFRRRVVAMSTVSGSSVGAMGIIALWANNAPAQQQTHFARNVFQHNYLTGGISDIFFSDFAAHFNPQLFSGVWPAYLFRGRNQRLQDEEAVCLEKALIRGDTLDTLKATTLLGRIKEVGSSMYGVYASLTETPDPNAKALKSYLSYYYPNGKLSTDLPLFLPNSLLVESGRRAVVSPVEFNSTTFLNAYDVVAKLHARRDTGKKPLNQTLSLGGAANLSELFPYVSAATFVPHLGHFVDGGYYDNYGLTTLLEFIDSFEKLKKASPKLQPLLDCIKINVICVINGNEEEVKDSYTQSMSQVTIPLQGAVNSIFGGHAEYMLARAKQKMDDSSFTMRGKYYKVLINEIKNKQDATKFALARDTATDKATVPLTRALSQRVIEQLEEKAAKNGAIIRVVDDFNGLATGGNTSLAQPAGRSGVVNTPGKLVSSPVLTRDSAK